MAWGMGTNNTASATATSTATATATVTAYSKIIVLLARYVLKLQLSPLQSATATATADCSGDEGLLPPHLERCHLILFAVQQLYSVVDHLVVVPLSINGQAQAVRAL